MLLGAMNNPMEDIVEEIALFADLGFDFIDFTLEPQRTYSGSINVRRVANALKNAGLGAIGHTAWYLPIASPFPEFRKLALRELERCLNVFHDLGVERMNLHPDSRAPLHSEEWVIAQNVEALAKLVAAAGRNGMKILVENTPPFSRAAQIKPLLETVPEAEFLLDIGHANVGTPYNRTEELLANFGHRLGHVHVSDNRGGADDQHLPLGVGNINWEKKVRALKTVGYDGTITIEVFSDDNDYLVMSRNKLKRLWDTVKVD
jgi:sugar phosphate isomerase/epimerase